MLFFIPIRVVGGGYHAETYCKCFLLSNIVSVVAVWLAQKLYAMHSNGLDLILWCLFCVAIMYIWKNVPVSSMLHPLKETQIIRNRKYAHVILGIDTGMIVLLKCLYDTEIIYAAMTAICFVACFILISKKGG